MMLEMQFTVWVVMLCSDMIGSNVSEGHATSIFSSMVL